MLERCCFVPKIIYRVKFKYRIYGGLCNHCVLLSFTRCSMVIWCFQEGQGSPLLPGCERQSQGAPELPWRQLVRLQQPRSVRIRVLGWVGHQWFRISHRESDSPYWESEFGGYNLIRHPYTSSYFREESYLIIMILALKCDQRLVSSKGKCGWRLLQHHHWPAVCGCNYNASLPLFQPRWSLLVAAGNQPTSPHRQDTAPTGRGAGVGGGVGIGTGTQTGIGTGTQTGGEKPPGAGKWTAAGDPAPGPRPPRPPSPVQRVMRDCDGPWYRTRHCWPG